MLIIPAIDIKDGCVVRLYQGEYDREKIYSQNPVDTARQWEGEGAELIHVVDLDGAMSGTPKNLDIVRNIARSVKVPIQFGGGIRTLEAIKELLAGGIFRVVLGTLAFEDRILLEKIINTYKEKIIVSVDITDRGTVALKGWVEDGGKQSSLISFVKAISKIGISKIIYTDIAKDGTLSGPRRILLTRYLNTLSKYNISMIMAGGISSLDDIKSLKKFEKNGLEGIIVGKALYEGKFTLSQAIKLA